MADEALGNTSLADTQAQDSENQATNEVMEVLVDPAAGKASSSTGGKIFIGGLSRDTTTSQLSSHFAKYGSITDAVIMKSKETGIPRGFGFITFADPTCVDKALKDKHVLNGRTVEVKKSVPQEKIEALKGPKTKKIFVGGLPTSLSSGELKEYFSKFGTVVECQILEDHNTGRSRGFGFVTFDSEKAVDDIIIDSTRHEIGGKQVEVKKAEPKKPFPEFLSERGGFGGPMRGGGSGGYGAYGGFGYGASDGYGPVAAYGYRGSAAGGYGGRSAGAYGAGSYGGYGGTGGFGAGAYGTGAYGSGFGGAGALSYLDDGLGGGAGGYGGLSGLGSYGGLGGFGGGGGGGGGGGYSSRGAYAGASTRYHPYSRN
eukprot:TRINITY_DN2982_c0_g2_i2.p1 TRINITY_DN2982_c0_g2~~TRINITY_DN2982_c0_g2_i2.p1  ORF type:complete len:371 (-),score=59.00 TRINITY_DN2982_c0_g2_i2:260-1372(-)